MPAVPEHKPVVSIIVPTYREAANIPVLHAAIGGALQAKGFPYEIVIVDDDSRDGIVEIVANLKRCQHNIRLIVRHHQKGLSSAVLEGIHEAKGDIVLVMDGDMSHPPQKIPELLAPIMDGRADFAIGSRFIAGGSALHFTWYRRLNALISRLLARPLTSVSDPMAGFFAFPRTLLTPEIQLHPRGFKIGMEIIVKAAPARIAEIPIHFEKRLHGQSKLSFREQLNYLIHLTRLYRYRFRR